MEHLSFFVGVLGNVTSILLFLSPMGTFWRIVRHRSTEEFESFPYICTLLSTTLWTYYGITRQGRYLVATINGFGAVLQVFYLSLFLAFAPPRIKAKTATLIAILDVGFAISTISVTQFAVRGDPMRVNVIGFICAGLNIVMYGSPLAAMRTVVMTKSVEYMPFLLSLFMFLTGGVWTFYAVLVHDWFLGVPNVAGFLFGIIQLVLYAIFRQSKGSEKVSDDVEDAWQHEQLLPSSSPNVS